MERRDPLCFFPSFQYSNIQLFQPPITPLLQSSFPPLPNKFLKRTIRIDAGAGFFYQLPVIPVFEQNRVEGPQNAGPWFYRMDQTLFVVVIEDAIPITSGFDGKLAVSFFTESTDEGLGRHSQKSGGSLYFSAIEVDTAFTVTAVTALFAFKSLHKK
jgi:hypothetical protein